MSSNVFSNKKCCYQVQNFGEPFFLVVRENETLIEVKQRIQKKLMISDDEFLKVSSHLLLYPEHIIFLLRGWEADFM